MKKVSVVIPVFNKNEYLDVCLNSALSSGVDDLEIICVDDYSTDGSYETLLNYGASNSRIRLYRNEENQGVSYSRNKGIDLAEGEYIIFLDADDYLEKDAIGQWVSEMESTHAQGCFISINTNKTIGIRNKYDGIFKGKELLSSFVKNDEMFLYACGAIWRRDFLADNRILFKPLKVGEGGLFILEALLKAKRVICSDYIGYHYNINQGSVSADARSMVYSAMGQAKQLIYMILLLNNDDNNEEIVQFARWYLDKNINGIKNLRKDDVLKLKAKLSESEELIFDLIRGDCFGSVPEIDDDDKELLKAADKVYLYGAGYETLSAIKLCNDYGLQILNIFVSNGCSHPENIYGFKVREFDISLECDKNVPFLITAHKKHHPEIKRLLKDAGAKRMITIGGTS